MELEKHEILFDVRRSIRYHERRMYFFETWHRVTSILTILLSGSILLQIAGDKFEPPTWLKIISFSAAILATIDMVVSYSKMSSLHKNFKRKFCELEIEVEKSTSISDIQACQSTKLNIEMDEPPIYRALDLLCRNELMSAMGYKKDEDYRSVHWFVRFTSQLYTWPNIGFDSNLEKII